MRDTTIYEPRAFWDIQSLSNEGGTLPLRVQFEKENFRNGSPYPIELRHLLIAPVGYVLNEYDGTASPPAALGDYGACASVLQRGARVMISSPNRQHYAMGPLRINAWQPEAVADMGMRYSRADPHASGLLGMYRWDFPKDRQMALPRNAACTFQLGTFLSQPSAGAGGFGGGEVLAHIAMYEEGAGHEGSRAFFWNAHTRYAQGEIFPIADPTIHPFQAADGMGSVVVGGGDNTEWPAGGAGQNPALPSQLSFASYKRQEASRAGYNVITGYGVHLDQSGFDDTLQLNARANFATSPVAPIGHRVPTRAMCDTGSQQWWWREGCPLSLVSPSLGPALVYKLPKPLWLNEGDVLELEMDIPQRVLDFAGSPGTGESVFQVGVSLLGHAQIKG